MLRRVLLSSLLLIVASGLFAVAPPVSAQSCATTIAASDTAALIAAIACANSTSGNETIALTNSTYTLSTIDNANNGLPIIPNAASAGTLTINGNGATLARSSTDGTPDFRFFFVQAGGDLRLNALTLVNGNTGASGGAMSSYGALTLTGVTARGNQGGFGGAISSGGRLVMRDSTLEGNSTTFGLGGAIYLEGGTLAVVNSTISGNQASSSFGGFIAGGAIYSEQSAIGIINSTIAFNNSFNAFSGVTLSGGTLTLQNSIVSNNAGANNCAVLSGGTITDLGGNVENGASCAFGSSSLSNADPQLAALAGNGGPTLTHAIPATSPAVNAGLNALAVDQTGAPLTADQRGAGFPRVLGGVVDSGAYESRCGYTYPYTVPAGDVADLIAAIECANLTTQDETINLTNSTYTLTADPNRITSGLPKIGAGQGALTINGNGATIARSSADGTPLLRFFRVEQGGVLRLNALTLVNGNSGEEIGGAIYFTNAALTLTGVTVRSSQGSFGGAIGGFGGTVVIRDSTLEGNTAAFGGGAIYTMGSLTLVNSTISGNQANDTTGDFGGGAIFSDQTVRIINSTIAFNSAAITARSGLWVRTGALTVQNSIVSDNGGVNNCAVTSGGVLTDAGGNVDSGASCGFGANSLSNADPQLAALADNGGPTRTHALPASSPAFNAGVNALAVDQTGAALTADQRGTGFPRINDATVDSGAFETNEAVLNITLTLQGRGTPPNSAHVLDTTVEFRTSPGNVLLSTRTQTSSSSGVVTIDAITPAVYIVRIKTPTTLAVVHTVTLAPGVNTLTTSPLRAGDANNDNQITVLDFSILSGSFGLLQGQAGYDARADFNGDNVVNINDFALMAINFAQAGAP